jgi:hypothetical protein
VRLRLIECNDCQRPWRRGDWIPADRTCAQCRNPGTQRLNVAAGCPACGLTVIEPSNVHFAEHCYPIAPPNVAYLAARDQLRAANAARREQELAA